MKVGRVGISLSSSLFSILHTATQSSVCNSLHNLKIVSENCKPIIGSIYCRAVALNGTILDVPVILSVSCVFPCSATLTQEIPSETRGYRVSECLTCSRVATEF